MAEQNPFGAPLGTFVTVPPLAPVAPVGLRPATPFAPPAPAAPTESVAVLAPPAPPAAPAQPAREDHPAMTLTELSFAPVETEPTPEPVVDEAPPPPGTSRNILPSGGGATRSISLGGRLPLVAVAVIALLAVVGVVFSTGLLKGDDKSATPVVKKPQVATPVKPAALPKGFKAVSVTKKSGTLGRAYALGAPTTWKPLSSAKVPGPSHTDLVLGDKVQGLIVETVSVPAGAGAGLDALAKAGRTGGVKASKGKAVGSIRTTKVAAHDARSFDIVAGGTRMRIVMFVDGTTLYTLSGATSSKAFVKFVPTYEKVLRSWAFAAK